MHLSCQIPIFFFYPFAMELHILAITLLHNGFSHAEASQNSLRTVNLNLMVLGTRTFYPSIQWCLRIVDGGFRLIKLLEYCNTVFLWATHLILGLVLLMINSHFGQYSFVLRWGTMQLWQTVGITPGKKIIKRKILVSLLKKVLMRRKKIDQNRIVDSSPFFAHPLTHVYRKLEH